MASETQVTKIIQIEFHIPIITGCERQNGQEFKVFLSNDIAHLRPAWTAWNLDSNKEIKHRSSEEHGSVVRMLQNPRTYIKTQEEPCACNPKAVSEGGDRSHTTYIQTCKRKKQNNNNKNQLELQVVMKHRTRFQNRAWVLWKPCVLLTTELSLQYPCPQKNVRRAGWYMPFIAEGRLVDLVDSLLATLWIPFSSAFLWVSSSSLVAP